MLSVILISKEGSFGGLLELCVVVQYLGRGLYGSLCFAVGRFGRRFLPRLLGAESSQ